MPKEVRSHHFLVAGLALSVLLWMVQAAQAQESTRTQSAGPEEVIVTGSRLRQPDIDTSNPTVSINAQSIELAGTTNLTDYLTNQPALIGSMDSTRTSGSAVSSGSRGLNLLNLRNLGIQRTLVLVDGRRHVAQLPQTAAVDIGTIPIDLVERVDIATGGVSAVYGADAVSGVVNFIMKKNFEGLAVRSQYGQHAASGSSKPANWHVAVTAGTNFADGRGNFSAAVEHTREGRLKAADRDYLRGTKYRRLQRNPDDTNDDPNVPDEIPLNNLRYFDSSREGSIDIDFDRVPDLRPNGAPYEITRFIPPFYTQGGTGTLIADYIGDLRAQTENTVTSAFAHYQLADSVNLFGEAKYAHSNVFSAIQPTYDYYIYLPQDNPFIPASIRSLIDPDLGGIRVNRDNFDLGVRAEDNTRDTWRTVVGLDGDISPGLRYEVSYVYGQTEVESISINNRFNDRFFAALDAITDPSTGQPVCRSNLDPSSLLAPYQGFAFGRYGPGELSFTPGANSGCLPLNILGEGVANPAAVEWVMTDGRTTSKLTQHVISGFVSGDLPYVELPGGGIAVVVGAEWRRETSRSTPPAENQAGLTFNNVLFPTRGDFDVKEVFTEVRLPVLKDRPFADLLQLTGALRFSDYTTIGNTTTWNLGATWAPLLDVTFRGTLAQSVRAPNIEELFDPQGETFQAIADPCDATRLNNGSSYRAANCATILSALGIDPATYRDMNSAYISGVQHGNAALSEETAKSWTVGAVFRPGFFRGLAVSVDLYDLKIKDAINRPEAQTLADSCIDQPNLDNVFCAGLTRDPVDGRINSFVLQPENVASFRTRGVDFNINYQFRPTGLGTFSFVLAGNYLSKLTFIDTPDADVEDNRTTKYSPKWQNTLGLTWAASPVKIHYGFNYFSKTKRYSLVNLAGDPDLASPDNIEFNARSTHDVQVAVDLVGGVNLYAGVNNITNQKPDLDTIYPVSPVGRFLYMGAKFNLANNLGSPSE